MRAALGLVANAVDAARTLPDRAVELPVLAVSTALQFSLRAQQRYAELTLRGDELLGRLHAPPEEPPSWATFDDQESADVHPAAEPPSEMTPGPSPADIPLTSAAEASPAAPVKSAAKQPRVRKAPAKKTTAAAKAKDAAAKTVRAPRQAKPSAFDRTDED